MRVLSSSNSDDGEDGDDDDGGDGDDGGGGDDNNGGNNNTNRGTYSLEGHMQGLCLTSSQHYGVGYGFDHRPQLEKSAGISTGFSTYCRDDYDDFVFHHNLIWKRLNYAIFMNVFGGIDYIMHVFRMFLLTAHVFMHSLYH